MKFRTSLNARISLPSRLRSSAALGLFGIVGFFLSALPVAAKGGEPTTSANEFSLSTAFAYSGRLQQGGVPADGVYDISFELFDAETGGTYLGRVDRFNVRVEAGVFTAHLDFGMNVFGSEESPYVQIDVRRSQSEDSSYTELRPRQALSGVDPVCIVDSDVQVDGLLTVDASGIDPGMQVNCCNDVEQSGQVEVFGFLASVQMDSDELQAVSLGMPTSLQLSPNDGGVMVGAATGDLDTPLTLPPGPDVAPGSGGSLLIGSASGRNIAIDNNEIMSRNGGVADLFLNNEGGDVRIGGASGGFLNIGLERIETNDNAFDVFAVCPAGKRVISGGCDSSSRFLRASHSNADGTAWKCSFEGASPVNDAIALCANVEWP